MASPFYLRPAHPDDAVYLAPSLRDSDRQEVAATHVNVEHAVRFAIQFSPICDIAELNGLPAVVLGCGERDGGAVGVPWLLATNAVRPLPGALTKLGQAYVKRFLARWPTLMNHVDARNTASIEWLRFLGFEIREPIPFGLRGEPFHPFVMVR